MEHEPTLIATVAIGFVVAFSLGYVADRIKLPPLVGYLFAGVLAGPYVLGFVGDVALSGQLAEMGVILLMFGVGLSLVWGWSFGAGLVFGLSLSVASTVVVLRALEQQGTLDSANGRITVGWLIVEDLSMVVALVLLPALAEALGGHAVGGEAG